MADAIYHRTLTCDLRLTDNPATPWRITGITTPGTTHGVAYRFTIGLAREILGIVASNATVAG